MTTKTPDIGAMDRRLYLFRRESTREDGGGLSDPVEVPVATVWAQEAPLRGTERVTARQLENAALTRFRIRYRADVRPDLFARCDNVTYNVTAVVREGRENRLLLDCEEVRNG